MKTFFRWAENNFFNFRALKQAQNIKSQLKELMSKVDFKVCEEFLENDHICKYYKQKKSENSSNKYKDDGFGRWEKVRMALTAGLIQKENFILIDY